MIDINNPDIVRILRLTKMRADVQAERNRIRHRLFYWESIYKSRKIKKEIKEMRIYQRNGGLLFDEHRLNKLQMRLKYSKKIPKKHLDTKFNVLRKKVIELKYDYAKVQLEICNLTHDTSAELRGLLNKYGMHIFSKPGGATISHLGGYEITNENLMRGEIHKKYDVKRIEEILFDKDIENILLKGDFND